MKLTKMPHLCRFRRLKWRILIKNVTFLRYVVQIDAYVKRGSYVRHIYWTSKKISNKNYRFWIFDLKEFKFNFQSMAAEEEFKKFENFSWIFEIFFAKFCVILRHKNARSDEFMSSSIQAGYRFFRIFISIQNDYKIKYRSLNATLVASKNYFTYRRCMMNFEKLFGPRQIGFRCKKSQIIKIQFLIW